MNYVEQDAGHMSISPNKHINRIIGYIYITAISCQYWHFAVFEIKISLSKVIVVILVLHHIVMKIRGSILEGQQQSYICYQFLIVFWPFRNYFNVSDTIYYLLTIHDAITISHCIVDTHTHSIHIHQPCIYNRTHTVKPHKVSTRKTGTI